MKAVWCFLVVLLSQRAICGIIRNQPAFSKPVYSDSYLPAAMQVIFHAVEQLKLLRSEEPQYPPTTRSPSTSPITHMAPTEQSPTTTTSTTIRPLNTTKIDEEHSKVPEASKNKTNESNPTTEESPKPDESNLQIASNDKVEHSKDEMGTVDDKIDASKVEEISKIESDGSKVEETSEGKIEETEVQETLVGDENNQESMADPSGHEESPEVNEETPETNYATPETNYEAAEVVHAVQETNQELPEENHEWISTSDTATETNLQAVTSSSNPTDSSTSRGSIAVKEENEEEKKKKPTIDSVVQGVYEILKPTTSKFVDEPYEESKSVIGVAAERMENVEEEEDETRFTRLGEKVTQVPRPSLSSYLRRSKVPPSVTLQQLASLYDSLSKDARKQGFGKYTGYSDEVLNTLETSAEGGIGPQLKKILAKVLERNELTREDAKTKTSQAVKDLDNPSSNLSKELRPLLPLRYSP